MFVPSSLQCQPRHVQHSNNGIIDSKTSAECLPGMSIVLGATDLAVREVEMNPAENLPSEQEGQAS